MLRHWARGGRGALQLADADVPGPLQVCLLRLRPPHRGHLQDRQEEHNGEVHPPAQLRSPPLRRLPEDIRASG